MDRTLKTWVPGLDDLLRKPLALPPSGHGLIILIKGKPGTGKSTLALQLAGGACFWEPKDTKAKKVYYCTCEQDVKDVQGTCERLNVPYYDKEKEIYGSKKAAAADKPTAFVMIADKLSSSGPEAPLLSGSVSLDWVNDIIATWLAGVGRCRMVVVDGLNTLGAPERHTLELENLVSSLRKHAMVGILVYEPDPQAHADVDFLADMVIELRGETVDGPPKYFLNELVISKSRFQQSVLGWHQYKIRAKSGINVFPSLHFRIHTANRLQERFMQSMKPITAPNPAQTSVAENVGNDGSVLAYLLGKDKLKRGSCTVVLGPRRSWKTLLTLDFLRAGSRKKTPEAGLLLSVMDNQGTIIEQRKKLCERLRRKGGCCSNSVRCYKHVYLFHIPPGCLAPDEFFHYLERRIAELPKDIKDPIRRLVFWDLSQLEYRFPLLANHPMFLTAMMDYLKNSLVYPGGPPKRITSLFMGAPFTRLAVPASAMADNVIFCWRDMLEGTDQTVIALYLDRIEGQPGKGKLFYVPDLLAKESKAPRRPKDIVRSCEEGALIGAKEWIRQIQEKASASR